MKKTAAMTWACGLVAGLIPFVAGAAALTWDADTSDGVATDGSGTWDVLNTNWWDGAANRPWTNSPPDNATFGAGGTAGTVTLGGGITVSNITFAAVTNGSYLLQGNILTLSVGSTITANTSATISSVIAGTGSGLIKTGSGTLTLSGANTYSGVTAINAGTVTYTGAGASSGTGGTNLYVGGAAGRGVLNLNANGAFSFATSYTPYIGGAGGGADTGVGAVNQTTGTVTMGASGGTYLTLGAASSSSYGSYELSGGTLTTPAGAGLRIGYGGRGSYVQSGGTLNCGRWFALGGSAASGRGVATFTGGSATFNPTYRILIPDVGNATSTFNVGTAAGGSATLTHLSTTGVGMENAAGGNGTLNLNRGTLILGGPIFRNNTTGGGAILNLNGGTLQAGGNNITLIASSLSSVNVYNGGVTVDSQVNAAVIAANMLAPSGLGLYPAGGTVAVSSNGGNGYIGAPLVTVSGGSGSGATAIALVSSGTVTAVTLTCPGQNYQTNDTVSFSFGGGGATTPASTFSYVLSAADVASNSAGGLVKVGSGRLTLIGTSTYAGLTTISNGTLVVNGSVGNGTCTVVSAATTLSGLGAVGGPVISSGLVLPGTNGLGALGVGGYLPSSSATLAMNIGGTSTYGVLNVAGTATLGGTLRVAFTNGFTPYTACAFPVVTAAVVSGTFATSSLPALPSGLGWDVQYSNTGVVAAVTGAATLIQVTPGNASFGAVRTGATAIVMYSVTNISPDTLVTGTVSIADGSPPFSVTSGTEIALLPGETAVVAVAFSPETAGNSTGSVVFATDLGGTVTSVAVGTGLTPDLAWNPAGGTGPSDGDGTWNSTTQAWWGGVLTPWANGYNAIFGNGGAPGTVSLGAPITGSNITFAAVGSGSYSIQSNTLSLSSPSTIAANTNAAIGSVLAAGSLVKTGGGILTLTGANTYGGGTTVGEGTLQIGNGLVNGTFGTGTYAVASTAVLRLNYATAAGPTWANIGGAGSLVLTSAQPVNSTANWGAPALPAGFTGTLVLANGRVGTASPASLGGVSSIEVRNTGGQLLVGAGTFNIPITIGGQVGWGENGDPEALRLAGNSGTATWNGPITLAADSGIMVQRGNSTPNNFIIAGSITGPYQCEFYAGDPVSAVGGTLTVAPTAATQNAYGSTKISGAGSPAAIVAGNAYAFSTNGLLVNATGVLKLNGFSFAFANVSGSGTVGNYDAATASILTVGSDDSATAFGGRLVDGGAAALGLVKIGAGTLTLGGSNTCSGGTGISNGTLLVHGSIGTGAVAVAAGATLGGTGTVNGTVFSAGTVAPGASPGVLTLAGDYTQAVDGVLSVEIGGASEYDVLVVGGAATLGGTLEVALVNGYVPTTNDLFVILNAGSVDGAFSVTNLPALDGGDEWVFTQGPDSVYLTVAHPSPPLSGYDLYAQQITNGLTGVQDDADGDGYANLLEYVTGGSPIASDAMARMSGVRSNGVLALVFRRDTNSVDATLFVEGSNSPTNNAPWTGIATNAAGVWSGPATVSESGAGNPVTVKVEDSEAPAAGRYLRLRVSRP
jgi:autotransporter-associated beta strand protein